MRVARPQAALGVKRENVPGVLLRALAIYNAMLAAAALFAGSPISAPAFLALIEALQTAQQQVTGTRAKGMGTARDAKRDDLWTALGTLQAYVQSLANAATAQNAVALIESAGFLVAKVAAHQKPILEALLTTTPGMVTLKANASVLTGKPRLTRKTTFHWQFSADGTNWTSVTSTPYAKTAVPGLTLMTKYYFRVRVTVGDVEGAWSDAISLLVH